MIYNPYPQVDLPFGKDNLYFKILFDAIMKVDESFVKYENKLGEKENENEEKNDKERNDHIERVFAYELYRQWFNLLEAENIKSLILNAETHKYFETVINYECEHGKESISVYPDMVLHHSQGDCINQKMICEIKRNKGICYEKILADLYKLKLYMEHSVYQNNKAFDYGVFILEGGKMAFLKELLKKKTLANVMENNISIDSFNNNDDDNENNKSQYHSEHIVCIAYDGTTLEYETLDHILKEI